MSRCSNISYMETKVVDSSSDLDLLWNVMGSSLVQALEVLCNLAYGHTSKQRNPPNLFMEVINVFSEAIN